MTNHQSLIKALCAATLVVLWCGAALRAQDSKAATQGIGGPGWTDSKEYREAATGLDEAMESKEHADATAVVRAEIAARALAAGDADAATLAKAADDARKVADADATALVDAQDKFRPFKQALDKTVEAASRQPAAPPVKMSAAAKAKEDAKIAASRKEAEDEAEANARLWYANSVALAKKTHWIAVVQMEGDARWTAFRYDHFPGVERMVDGNGASYVRLPGKDWVVSKDWGKTGAPLLKDLNGGPVDDMTGVLEAMNAAILDAVAEMAQREFQPDPKRGKLVWNVMDGRVGTFQQDPEKQPGAGHPPMVVVFHDDVHSFYSKDQSASLLRQVLAQWDWVGKPAQVAIHYFYKPGETAPPKGATPEDELAQALAAATAKPVKVDAVINGASRFLYKPKERVRVAGIVSGNDFDLTVATGDAVTREIAVGDDAWSSADGGRTWQKLKEADRTYFDEAVRAWRTVYSVPWPVEAADAALRPGDAAVAGGEALRRFQHKVRHNDSDDPDEYWVAMKDGKPAELRRYEQRSFFSHLYADYADVPDGQGVLPPPGNPGAAPSPRPEELLVEAIDAMEGAGVWHVEWNYADQRKTGQKNGHDVWGDTRSVQRITGLVSGKDFDLTGTTTTKNEFWRMVGVKDAVWQNSNVYPKWELAANNGGFIGNAPLGYVEPDLRRSDYNNVFKGFQSLFVNELYEAVGTETHDGAAWLHIRMIGEQERVRGRPEYWIERDKAGNAVAVRHYLIITANGGTDRPFPVDDGRESIEAYFAPAKTGEKVALPEAAK